MVGSRTVFSKQQNHAHGFFLTCIPIIIPPLFFVCCCDTQSSKEMRFIVSCSSQHGERLDIFVMFIYYLLFMDNLCHSWGQPCGRIGAPLVGHPTWIAKLVRPNFGEHGTPVCVILCLVVLFPLCIYHYISPYTPTPECKPP